MTTEKTVNDIETEKTIIVSRFLANAEALHLHGPTRRTLDAIGLGDYLPSVDKPFSVDLSQLVGNLPQKATIKAIPNGNGIPDRSELIRMVRLLVEEQTDKFVELFYKDEVSVEPIQAETKAVDPDAVNDEWGSYTSPYPKAGSDEVEQFRRELITAALEYGIANRLCEDLENSIRRVGLGEYLPPSKVELTYEIPGFDPITVTTNLTRSGKRDELELDGRLGDAIIEQLRNRGELTPVVATPNDPPF